jgi:uncharacterized protein YqjF (DUF2071 family)
VARQFLTARWQDLAIITYAVPRELLAGRVPAGLELDEREGQVFVSLVAFDFRGCRVMGVGWPGMTDFPEVNLRYYVRERATGRRGVIFIREFVRSRLITAAARWIYGEPYVAIPMSSGVTRARGRVRVEHKLTPRGTSPVRIALEADDVCYTPDASSVEHFFKEHSWGYGVRRGRTLVYEVGHPAWQVCRGARAELDIDFGAVYGREWGALNGMKPWHVMLAVGSPVEVWGHKPLE